MFSTDIVCHYPHRKQKAKERRLYRAGAAQSQRGSQREESSREKNGSQQEEEARLKVGHPTAAAAPKPYYLKLSPKKADKLVSKWFVCTILKDTRKFLTPRKEGEISSKKKGDAEVSKKMVRKINRL